MAASESLIFCILISLLTNTYCQSIDPSSLEAVLRHDWSLSPGKFLSAGGSSIVAYDADVEKVIIFGGESDAVSAILRWRRTIYEHMDWNYTYIYDIAKDRLTPIRTSWPYLYRQSSYLDFETSLINYATTNAIVINSYIYFATDTALLIYDSAGLYKMEAMLNGEEPWDNSFDIRQYPIEISYNIYEDEDYWAGQGCVVTNQNQDHIFIIGSALEPRTSQYIIMCSITSDPIFDTPDCTIAGQTLYDHIEGPCVVMHDILYIIGGFYTNTTEYATVSSLVSGFTKFTKEKNLYQGQMEISAEEAGNAGSSVIQDDDNKLIYILGGRYGYPHNREIYKMNTSSQTMELLDFYLPDPGINFTTTILSKSNGKIYAFRGLDGWNADQIAFSNSIYQTISPTVSPTKEPSDYPSQTPSVNPTHNPSVSPSNSPSGKPTQTPTVKGETRHPSINPTMTPSNDPSKNPTTGAPTMVIASESPSSSSPTLSPTDISSKTPINSPSIDPTKVYLMYVKYKTDVIADLNMNILHRIRLDTRPYHQASNQQMYVLLFIRYLSE